MKIFIMTDLEGISGISRKEQVDNSERYALERLMADVNAAIRGAFDGGADEENEITKVYAISREEWLKI